MIGFLHPAWLWALPATGLPLVLHLVARRQPPTVPFPAVRYLQQVTRDQQRRLKLRHWLLLLMRTLLVLALVLAAAAPTVAHGGLAGHAPAGLVLVLDNSPSSGAVTNGTPVLERLRAAARGVLDKATGEDMVWLVTADGVTRRGPIARLRAAVESLAPSEIRLDLGGALRRGRDVLAEADRPAEIIVLSDLQATALTAAEVAVPVLVGVPDVVPPLNLGVATLDPGAQPWSPGENRVRVQLDGDSGRTAPMTLRVGSRPGHPQWGQVGAVLEVPLEVPAPGWWPVSVELDPDELRADDRRHTLVRVLPVARARWDSADHYLDAAAATLREGGRLRDGNEVALGWLGPGASVVTPPPDPAALGALNRALERRGVPWRFGGLVVQEQMSDSGPLIGATRVSRRVRLTYAGAAPLGIEATVGGEPWIVRAGTVVLIGSRLDPAWTGLPAAAGFVPLVDALANRLVRGEQALLTGVPGVPVRLPDAVDRVLDGPRAWRVEGGGAWRPPAGGVYFLLSGADTLGALAANLDPRESDLTMATRPQIRALWPGARLVPLPQVREAAFGAGTRGHARAPLLWLALLFGLAEVALATPRRRGA